MNEWQKYVLKEEMNKIDKDKLATEAHEYYAKHIYYALTQINVIKNSVNGTDAFVMYLTNDVVKMTKDHPILSQLEWSWINDHYKTSNEQYKDIRLSESRLNRLVQEIRDEHKNKQGAKILLNIILFIFLVYIFMQLGEFLLG